MDYLKQLQDSFEDELSKIASELSTAGREHIKAKNFALSAKQSDTGKPAYPIHDKAHAANALARVKQFGSPAEKAEVYRDVARKYPELSARSDVAAVRDKVKESAAVVKETRRAWNVPSSRKGSRSMKVSTLLKKEKDGSLGGYKLAQFYGPIVPFTEAADRGQAPTPASKAPGAIPSREEMASQHPKREDGRESAHTMIGPGVHLVDIAPTNPGN